MFVQIFNLHAYLNCPPLSAVCIFILTLKTKTINTIIAILLMVITTGAFAQNNADFMNTAD